MRPDSPSVGDRPLKRSWEWKWRKAERLASCWTRSDWANFELRWNAPGKSIEGIDMMDHSMVEIREAEQLSHHQRLGFRNLLRIDESKAGSSAAIMVLRRMKTAAETGDGYDDLLADPGVDRPPLSGPF